MEEDPVGFTSWRFGMKYLLLPVRVAEQARQESEAARRALLESQPGEEDQVEDEPATAPVAAVHVVPDSHRKAVYADDEVLALAARAGLLRDVDDQRRLKKVAGQLSPRGTGRDVIWPKSVEAVRDLSAVYPNFEGVINLVHQHLVLAQVTNRPPMIPPVLLHGEPGVGKSHFARALVEALGAPLDAVRFDVGAENSALLGLDKHWGNSQHGVLFQRICLGETANACVLLEEIDKAHTYKENSPLAALHTLLEPSTAAWVEDLSLQFKFDTSLVFYIATANDLTAIPLSLQSRFRIFEIKFPGAAQAIEIAWRVANATIEKVAPPGFQRVSRKHAVALAHLTPREITQVVTSAVACAVVNNRRELRLSDLPPDLFDQGDDHAPPLH